MADKKPSEMDEIRAVLRDVGRRLTALASRDEEADKRQVEADKRQVEADRRRKAEADKRQAEADKRQAEADKRKAEADKRKAEADKRQAEADKRQAEADKRQAEADRRRKAEADKLKAEADKRQAKTDLQLQETDKQLQKTSLEVEKTVKSIKQLRRQVGGQHNRWGKIVEDLVAGDLCALLETLLSIEINHVSTRVRGSYQSKNWEIDLLAVNQGTVVPVEVKTTLAKADIDGFIRRILQRLTDLIPAHRGARVYGAIAFVKIADNEEETIDYALHKGLIVIKAMRGTNHIINPKDYEPHDFHPRRAERG